MRLKNLNDMPTEHDLDHAMLDLLVERVEILRRRLGVPDSEWPGKCLGRLEDSDA